MFSPAFVCLFVCLSVSNITRKRHSGGDPYTCVATTGYNARCLPRRSSALSECFSSSRWKHDRAWNQTRWWRVELVLSVVRVRVRVRVRYYRP